jgi:hypothetical protein
VAQIVISRPRYRWEFISRNFKIDVDGERVATLPAGGEVVIEVASGVHTVKARQDWPMGSQTVELHLADRDQAHMTCKLPTLLRYYLLYFYWFIRPNEFLDLRLERQFVA